VSRSQVSQMCRPVPEAEQLFLRDPYGNMIELHQVDKCRCRAANRDGYSISKRDALSALR